MLTALAPPSRPVLIYDGECAFCRRWVERIRRWDRRHAIDAVPFQDAARVARFGIPKADLHAAMHLVLPDGRAFAGGAAAPEILKLLPGKRWLAWGFGVPGVLWVATRLYRWIAKRRHRLSCGSHVCGRGG
ncbi:MAG: thiol-disulfide oxidoreductase DCC family protein [Gemmatimonadales bacterium]